MKEIIMETVYLNGLVSKEGLIGEIRSRLRADYNQLKLDNILSSLVIEQALREKSIKGRLFFEAGSSLPL